MGGSLAPVAPVRKRVPVLLPRPFQGTFDYAVPPGMDPRPGDVVLVPLNRREEVGVVWDLPAGPSVADGKLKPVTAVLEAVPFPVALRRFIDWVAGYTLSTPGEVLAMALRVNALQAETPQAGWRIGDIPADARLTDARVRIAAALANGAPMSTSDLVRAAGRQRRGGARDGQCWPAAPGGAAGARAVPPSGPGPSRPHALRRAVLRRREPARRRRRPQVHRDAAGRRDGIGQDRSLSGGCGGVHRHRAAGAGAAAGDRAVLPVAGAVRGALRRGARRCGTRTSRPAPGGSPGAPSRTGAAPVVVGARSALFLPFPDLGLVVVDEEHETAFKQEDGVVYHARDMAVVRARLSNAPAVLVSATPSLETLANVETGRYRRMTLEVAARRRDPAEGGAPSTCASPRRSAGASCPRRWWRRCRRRSRAGSRRCCS